MGEGGALSGSSLLGHSAQLRQWSRSGGSPATRSPQRFASVRFGGGKSRGASSVSELSIWHGRVVAAGLGLHGMVVLLRREDLGAEVAGESCVWFFNLWQWRRLQTVFTSMEALPKRFPPLLDFPGENLFRLAGRATVTT